VDVVVADHAAPRVVEKLHGFTMIAIEGGTQALRRTVNARLNISDDRTTTISVPSPFGALIPRRGVQDVALAASSMSSATTCG
jgi:hypothetical protein